MAKFLTRTEIYRLLQREMPEGVFADGEPDAFDTTADNDSFADCAATAYYNASRIYDNYWPQLTDESVSDWEITVFGKNLDASLTLQQRRDRIVGKIRNPRGLTKADMIAVVKGIIGDDKIVDAIEWGCSDGGWQLDISELDIETYLNGQNLVDVTGPMICEDTPADQGKTDQEWAEMQEDAYTYEVLIYSYVLSAEERAAIDLALSETEPARSQHIITDNQNPNDIVDGDT